jgi:tol-pal system protein YbgF
MRRALIAAALTAATLFTPAALRAQDNSETLADIRQELTVLFVEIQRLKREMSTTGAPAADLQGSTVLDRVNAIESELQRLTAQTEQMQLHIGRIVEDGTNRIGDLEFRLVELEGGDISQLGETSTLGGDAPGATVPGAGSSGAIDPAVPAEELAVGEQADFDAAQQALTDGDFQGAADRFAAFEQAYPGSPLAQEANYHRGKALDSLGDTREAARSYLAAFSGNATGPRAPDALFELGAALGRLGQTEQACITLAEVAVRFPDAEEAKAAAAAEMSGLNCS